MYLAICSKDLKDICMLARCALRTRRGNGRNNVKRARLITAVALAPNNKTQKKTQCD